MDLASELKGNLIAIANLVKNRSANKAIVSAPMLDGGGKLGPAALLTKKCSCGKSLAEVRTCKRGVQCALKVKKEEAGELGAIFVPIAKANDEEQTVTGIVLQPETVDAHGDIYSHEVVKQAAYGFLSRYNASKKLGKQHKDFKNWKNRFALVESYVAPIDFVLETKSVKAGSWIMTVKVLNSEDWKLVKEGKLTGFSIGGRARAVYLKKPESGGLV